MTDEVLLLLGCPQIPVQSPIVLYVADLLQALGLVQLGSLPHFAEGPCEAPADPEDGLLIADGVAGQRSISTLQPPPPYTLPTLLLLIFPFKYDRGSVSLTK